MKAFVQGVQTIMCIGVGDKSTIPLLVTCSVGGMGKTEFINHLFRTNDVSRRSHMEHTDLVIKSMNSEMRRANRDL